MQYRKNSPQHDCDRRLEYAVIRRDRRLRSLSSWIYEDMHGRPTRRFDSYLHSSEGNRLDGVLYRGWRRLRRFSSVDFMVPAVPVSVGRAAHPHQHMEIRLVIVANDCTYTHVFDGKTRTKVVRIYLVFWVWFHLCLFHFYAVSWFEIIWTWNHFSAQERLTRCLTNL